MTIVICCTVLFTSQVSGQENLDLERSSLRSIPKNSERIEVRFEKHPNGTKYNRFAQNKDWRVVGTNDSWMNKSEITQDEKDSNNRSLRITYLPEKKSGGSAVWGLPRKNEYYLSYRVKFAKDFDFDGSENSGGKLPGLGARDKQGNLCSGGQICNGNNGFSSRYMWRENGRAELYLYHMDKPGKWGEDFYFKGRDGSKKFFERGKWHSLVQRVKINDGKQANGEIDVWMDGEKVLSINKLKFVTNSQKIDSLYFSTFHGGNNRGWFPDRKVYSYWDDFVISTSAADVSLDLNRCLLYTSPSPRDLSTSRMPSSA